MGKGLLSIRFTGCRLLAASATRKNLIHPETERHFQASAAVTVETTTEAGWTRLSLEIWKANKIL
jgi:hypothetical protein